MSARKTRPPPPIKPRNSRSPLRPPRLRDQVSGVSLDAQAIDVLQFQRAYQATRASVDGAQRHTRHHHEHDDRHHLTNLERFYVSQHQRNHPAISGRSGAEPRQQLQQARRRSLPVSSVQQPSDNPAAISEILQTETAISNNKQIQSNLTNVTTEVNTADSALQTAVQALESAISLASQGASSTVSADTRTTLAQQVAGIQQTLVGIAQTTVNGQLYFQRRSGHPGSLPAGFHPAGGRAAIGHQFLHAHHSERRWHLVRGGADRAADFRRPECRRNTGRRQCFCSGPESGDRFDQQRHRGDHRRRRFVCSRPAAT